MEKGRLVNTLHLEKAFKISFEINPSSVAVSDKPANIIHFTTGGSCCGWGTRIPIVSFQPYTTNLSICTAIDNNANRCFNFESHPLQFNKFTKVEITQQQHNSTTAYMFNVKIGDNEVLNVQNSNPKSYTNVQIYKASRFYEPAKAQIRRFIYKNVLINEEKQSKTVINEEKQSKTVTLAGKRLFRSRL